MESTIAIVDYECLSSLGTSFEETWVRLLANSSGIGPIDRYHPEEESLQGVSNVAYGGQIPISYDELAGSSARFRKWNEPAFHAVKRLAATVLERVGLDLSRHDPQRIAVLGGTALCSQVSKEALTRSQRADSKFILNQCQNIPLAAAASTHGLQGPCFSIGSACASSGHALLLACQLIKADLIDCALVCGHEFPLLPSSVGGLDWLSALYRRDTPRDRGYDDPAQASRPLSQDRRGFVLAEGAALLLVARVDYAKKHGWPMKAGLRGGYANSDADHVTRISATNVSVCMKEALKDARCDPSEVECVNAHATSTPMGDRSELTALREVFGDRLESLPLVANKSQLGHSLGAASSLETALAAESLAQGILPPTLNYRQDPSLPTARVQDEACDFPHQLTLSNSFGFGGTNVSLVLERCS